MEDFSFRWDRKPVAEHFSFSRRPVGVFRLPHWKDLLWPREEHCLSEESVFWPPDGRCHQLLQRGPCNDTEWLVLVEDFPGSVAIKCRSRRCPCSPEEPQLCEVWHEGGGECADRCVVALAAEQEMLCRKGEQLLLSPFGVGVCGCRVHPPHARWHLDGACYALHTQGPCPTNHTFQWSPPTVRSLCVPSLCPAGLVLHSDGRCYAIGERGPCDENSTFVLESVDPACKPTVAVKRIFDMAPNRYLRRERQRNTILGSLRVRLRCDGGSCGNQAKKNNVFLPAREKRMMREDRARRYLKFLRSFSSGQGRRFE